jgi:hypothetical protein
MDHSPPQRRLENQVAVVTAGAGGIGAAIVRRFVDEGAGVVLSDVKEMVSTIAQPNRAKALRHLISPHWRVFISEVPSVKSRSQFSGAKLRCTAQMYVERVVFGKRSFPVPVVSIHGGTLTGAPLGYDAPECNSQFS